MSASVLTVVVFIHHVIKRGKHHTHVIVNFDALAAWFEIEKSVFIFSRTRKLSFPAPIMDGKYTLIVHSNVSFWSAIFVFVLRHQGCHSPTSDGADNFLLALCCFMYLIIELLKVW